MKKYKHIDTGKTVEIEDHYTNNSGTLHLIVSLYEESRDWKEIKEVVEMDYEILSFKQNSKCDSLWTAFGTGDGYWCKNHNNKAVTIGYTLNEILKSPLYTINSVKRLSDGIVFTVGDQVCRNKSWEHGTPCLITSFIVKGDKMVVNIKQSGTNGGTYPFDDIMYKFAKEPLFCTQDGVKIFEGDEHWYVSDDFSCIESHISKTDVSGICFGKLFSTKKAAEEYVLKNKPCLSLNDVYNAHRIIGYCNLDQQEKICDMTDKLKETVKNRL